MCTDIKPKQYPSKDEVKMKSIMPTGVPPMKQRRAERDNTSVNIDARASQDKARHTPRIYNRYLITRSEEELSHIAKEDIAWHERRAEELILAMYLQGADPFKEMREYKKMCK